MDTIRTSLTPAQRATPLHYTIDLGFVHHRKVQARIGYEGMRMIDQAIRELPELPDYLKSIRIDHIYTHVLLLFCNKLGVPPLEELLANRKGRLFCSTEKLTPCPKLFDRKRGVNVWVPRQEYPERVEFHYSTKHLSADTLISALELGDGMISIVAELTRHEQGVLIFEPLVMGFPLLQEKDTTPDFGIEWFVNDFFEHFIEDFEEFAQVRDVPLPKSPAPMKDIPEAGFKACLAQILGDTAEKDWGGESSDYYSAHLTLKNGRRATGAFLLKCPAKFAPMSLNHLGKNNDQIVRLAHEPADILFVQHCHDIGAPVRETLRAFAVQPSNARRYCLIDGRDSLRLLNAYGLYEKAKDFKNP